MCCVARCVASSTFTWTQGNADGNNCEPHVCREVEIRQLSQITQLRDETMAGATVQGWERTRSELVVDTPVGAAIVPAARRQNTQFGPELQQLWVWCRCFNVNGRYCICRHACMHKMVVCVRQNALEGCTGRHLAKHSQPHAGGTSHRLASDEARACSTSPS